MKLGKDSYSILIGNGLIKSLPAYLPKGISKIIVLSDEYFMGRLSTQLFSIIKPKDFKNTFPINDSFLDGFRKVAGIKQTERRGPKPYYAGGIAFLKKRFQLP